ncbi:MAG: amino acid ABC transporter permease [Clostridium sp.]|uniref:amino acid ABC transporter permease n=1 Tax=Clostridium sp. TaxID=1506 RepID=UPI003F36BBA7
MDIDFMVEQIPKFIDATVITLELGVLGIIFSVVIGIIFSNILFFKVKGFSRVVKMYVEVSRNTPLLIQLFFLYYGLTKVGLTISGFMCGVIGLTFLGGSYMTEVFRGALEGVRKEQEEAGLSIGLSKFKIYRYIVFPQALSLAIPGLLANILFLIKETSIVGCIAVADLMFLTKDIIGMYYKTSEALTMLVFFYLIILLPISIGASLIERRMKYV